MNWPLVGALVVGGLAFVIARIWVRRWVTGKWLRGTITDRQAAALFVLNYFSPILIVLAIAGAADPASIPILALIVLLILAPALAVFGGLLDYAANHGVKTQMLRDRNQTDAP